MSTHNSVAKSDIILDTNIILKDLASLAKNKVLKPEYRTNIMECIQANIFVAYITRHIENEVEEKIEKRCDDFGIAEKLLRDEWQVYRKMLKKRKVSDREVEKFILKNNIRDIDDAPTIMLAKKLNALIFTENKKDFVPVKDRLIANHSKFSESARDYAREMAVAIYFEGNIIYFGSISMEVFFSAIHSSLEIFKKLPGVIKMVVILAVITIVAHPVCRSYILDAVKRLCDKAISQDGLNVIDSILSIHDSTLQKIPEYPHVTVESEIR
jgi:predicted nucleic acid-binding protein